MVSKGLVLPRGHFSKPEPMAKQQPSVKERKRRQVKRSKKDKQPGLEAWQGHEGKDRGAAETSSSTTYLINFG